MNEKQTVASIDFLISLSFLSFLQQNGVADVNIFVLHLFPNVAYYD